MALLVGMRCGQRVGWTGRGAFGAICLLILSALAAHGQRVSISLFDATSVQTVLLVPGAEGYLLLLDGAKQPVAAGRPIRAERFGDSIRISSPELGRIGAAHAALVHMDPQAYFELEVLHPARPKAVYDGNLSLYVDFGRLMTNNLVDQEMYVAGVALAEVGGYATLELYKAQILLIRTYMLSQRNRHIDEGYNLCDQVHCQAYKGSARHFPTIIQAAQATKGLAILDRAGRFITSVFHANCGGQTAAAGDVWLTDNDYLRSVPDPYCRKSRGAHWSAEVALADWRRFLHSKGVPTERLSARDYTYSAQRREAVYALPGGTGVPFRDLREYFNLKSAWFDVEVQGDRVRLRGRGYGHGIGLCQEGAMRMGAAGKSAEEIIQFYFQGVRVAPAAEAVTATAP